MIVKKFWKVHLDDVDALKYWKYPKDYKYKEIFTFKNENFKKHMYDKDHFFISLSGNVSYNETYSYTKWGWMPGGDSSYEFYKRRDYEYSGEINRILKLERLKRKIDGKQKQIV